MEISRRVFLKLGVVLAVAAVVRKWPNWLIGSENERILSKIKTGRLENEIVYLDEPLKIEGLEKLTLSHCTFKASENFKGDCLIYMGDCKSVVMDSCQFLGNSSMQTIIRVS